MVKLPYSENFPSYLKSGLEVSVASCTLFFFYFLFAKLCLRVWEGIKMENRKKKDDNKRETLEEYRMWYSKGNAENTVLGRSIITKILKSIIFLDSAAVMFTLPLEGGRLSVVNINSVMISVAMYFDWTQYKTQM
jgi:hypothetical protein